LTGTTETTIRPSLLRRLWSYQRERFPLPTHGLLVAVLAWGSVAFSAASRGATALPAGALMAAFFITLGFFFQLRVADEYKDYADDAAHRPYRPVPRGLVTLGELARVALGVAVLQGLIALVRGPILLVPLLLVWAMIGLLRQEFFIADTLRRHPLLYMLSHMLVTPAIVAFATACDWLAAGAAPPAGLDWFLVAAYANGMVFEVGRKLRAPKDEEPGVETYSALWGPRRAALLWLAALAVAGIATILAAVFVGATQPAGLVAGAGIAAALWISLRFGQSPTTTGSKVIQAYSAIWLLAAYLVFGLFAGT
jgi:hypothetical protein